MNESINEIIFGTLLSILYSEPVHGLDMQISLIMSYPPVALDPDLLGQGSFC